MDDVVALHGFAGTGALWSAVGSRLAGQGITLNAPDLPGHGARAQARPIDLGACVRQVLADAPDRFVLCGYSLGGRVAIAAALAAPERVRRLVLVSTGAGIEDPAEREARRAADERLAGELESMAIDEFADRWASQAIFAGEPAEARETQRRDVLGNDPRALAVALRALGQGAVEPMWSRLRELTMPSTVVVGERDTRYVELGGRLVARLGRAAPLVVVPGAGHGLPREAPAALAELLVR